MADLPLPSEQLTTTEMPSQRATGAVFQSQPTVGVGSGLQVISEGVDAIAQTAAAKQGRDNAAALERNPDGSIKPIDPLTDPSHFILGNAGRAYQHAFDVGTLAAVQNDAAVKINDMRNQYPGDPQSFLVAAGKYADGLRSTLGGALGDAAFQHATRLGTEYYVGAVNQKKTDDAAANEQSITTRIGDLKTDILNVARGTQSDDASFIDKLPEMAQLRGFSQSLAGNPLFSKTWTQEKIDSELKQFQQETRNAWAFGNAQRIRDRDGVDAAVNWAKANVLNSDTNMPFDKRFAAFNAIVSQVQTLTSEQTARQKAAAVMVDGAVQAYASGTPLSEEKYQQLRASAQGAFAVDAMMKLDAAKAVYDGVIKPNASLPFQAAPAAIFGPGNPVAEQTAKQFFVSRGWTPEQAAGIVGNLSHESGGKMNPNARAAGDGSDGSDSIGIGQWNQNRAKDLQAFAASRGKPWNDLQTQLEFVDHELNNGEAVAGGVLRGTKTVQDATAAMLGYERPRGYSAGGDPAAALGWQSRLAAAQRVAGGGSGPASPIPFTGAQIRDNPYVAALALQFGRKTQEAEIQDARTQADLIGRAIGMGGAPDPRRVAQVLQVADQNPGQLGDVATKLRAQVSAAPLAMQSAGYPDSGQSYVNQAQEIARHSPDLFHLEQADFLQRYVNNATKAFADDPHAYAARQDVHWIDQPPVPMDAVAAPGAIGAQSTQEALQRAIGERREASFKIAANSSLAQPDAMFTKTDVASLTHMFKLADGASADTLLRGLQAQLHPDEMQALASNKDFTNAVGGLTRSGDPAKAGAAFSFMDKQWRENPEAFKNDYGSDMATRLAVWQDKIAFMAPDQAMREMQRANDPNVIKAMDGLREQADKENKDLTGDKVVSKVFGSMVPFMSPGSPVSNDTNGSSAAMLADYRAAYRDLYAESGGDKTIADKRALERVQMKWGPSDLNGGRVMQYPPEKYYPPDINGSRSYFNDQLSQAIVDASAHLQAQGVDPEKLRTAPRALVADATTQQDIASRRAPSYQVIVQGAGGWQPLQAAPGKPFRFFADRDSVVRGQIDTAQIQRRQSNENMQMGAF